MRLKRRSRKASGATVSKHSPASSAWTIRILDVAAEQIENLPKKPREHILDFIYGRLKYMANPRSHGRPLMGELSGFWRYRIDQHRIVCELDDEKRLIRIVRIRHRYDVYAGG